MKCYFLFSAILSAASLLCAAYASAQPTTQPEGTAADAVASRGQLLYSTHCVACHSTQVHWRDKKLATDWGKLVALVDEWQQHQQLNWSSEEVREVTRYLNDTFYHHPRATELGAPPARANVSGLSGRAVEGFTSYGGQPQ